MKKPVIGISSNEQANFDGWFNTNFITYSRTDAIKVVDDAQGVPIIIPVLDNENHIESYLDLIDGLIITGGHDVIPLYYGEDMYNECGNVHPKTDYFDICLIKAAIKRKMPTIVICRGVQIANIAFGGTLYQDTKIDLNSKIKHHAPEEGDLYVHGINVIEDDSLFSKLTNIRKKAYVNSVHHQAINDLASIFHPVAKANDGVIEVIELKDSEQFFVGMQFHPEILGSHGHTNMLDIFRGMVSYINDIKSR